MRQESGGHEFFNGQPTTSDAGAAGLMQVMPATYAELRGRYGFGDDPYNPHDNILAGTAYIKELYDRYGSPAFLAAYNAGPQRLDDYMAGRSSLPNQTVNYLASVAPRLGRDQPMSGPLAVYADNGGAPLQPDPVPRSFASAPIAGCWRDPDAAYDPDAPCRAAPPPRAAPRPLTIAANARQDCWHDPNAAYDPDAPCRPAPAVSATPAPEVAGSAGRSCWHDPNAAYDPSAPCQPAPVQVAEAVPAAARQSTRPGQVLWGSQSAPAVAGPTAAAPPHHSLASYLVPSAAASELPPPAAGAWSIQVGAFATADQARHVADLARGLVPHALSRARTVLGQTAPFGGHVLYRARLAGLSSAAASSACSALSAQRQACVTVAPGG